MGERPRPADDYMPQLDGLRAVAVGGVLVTHFLPTGHPFREAWPWGSAGVQLFFVLSGFLITGILLRCRQLATAGQGVGITLVRFYARRGLRIFPLYYVTIFGCLVFDAGRMRDTWGWHVPYLTNVGLVADDRGFGRSTHFWTLAVEEQFYLVWPLVVLLLPDRWVVRAMVVCVLVAPMFRLAAASLPVPYHARTVLTPACLDTLAAGGLLAWLRADPTRGRLRRQVTRGGLVGGGLVLAGLAVLPLDARAAAAADVLLTRLAFAGLFVWLIDTSAQGIRGPVGFALSAGPFAFVGRISYGVYVLHHFMIDLYDRLGLGHVVPGVYGRFAVLTGLSIGLAVASWYIIERPLNRLKERFPYRSNSSGGRSAVHALVATTGPGSRPRT